MATAIAAGSLLSSAGGAIAGASSAGAFLGIQAGTFTAISAGLGIAGTALSGFQQSQAAEAEAEAQQIASRQRARNLEFQVEQERTQSAIEEEDRQRRLRRTLASQRAAFGAGGADPFSGSPVRIQEDTEAISERDQERSDLTSNLRINSLEQQRSQELRAGQFRASSARRRGRTSLLRTGAQVSGQLQSAQDKGIF